VTKKGLTAIAAVVAAVFATAAWADDNEEGFYLGGGVGEFNVDIDDFDDLDETIDRYDSDDTAWKAFVGWRANQSLAFEIAYLNLGSPDDEVLPGTFVEIETDGFAPYIVGSLPFAAFELFAKAGYLVYDTEVRVTTPLGSGVTDESDEEFTWSAGLGLTVFDAFNVRLEYEMFDVQNVDDANALWLTGAFRF
jgi:opacity protein-like surface antigen